VAALLTIGSPASAEPINGDPHSFCCPPALSPFSMPSRPFRAKMHEWGFSESWRPSIRSRERLQNTAGSALKCAAILKTKRDACQREMFNEQKGYGFIKPDDGGADIFFHVSALQEGDEITEGKAVSFETGTDPKSGKIKAISVDLA
jgi:cold shock protein